MKYNFLIVILIFTINVFGQSYSNETHPVDSTLAKRISISGFCLCQTTLSDLQKLTKDLKLVNVEEMDLAQHCYGKDSRFINGKGYSSEQYSGIIFQKEENSDYISKIRLTNDFKGNLPNGSYIDCNNLKLKDVFQIYPELKNKWGSRDCSGYWSFSNDTISFFVKIDKSIQPQFPINKEFYMDKPVEAIDFLVSCYGIFHKPINLIEEPSNEPLYFLDSIKVNRGVIEMFTPTDIAFISVFKDKSAIRMAGDAGKNGIIYIYTKEFARNKYWNYFKSKSPEYLKAIPSIEKEAKVVYIINDKVLDKDYEATLFDINDSNFIELKMISKKQLKNNFHIAGKEWGVIIKTIPISK